jgi:hypothetical protein
VVTWQQTLIVYTLAIELSYEAGTGEDGEFSQEKASPDSFEPPLGSTQLSCPPLIRHWLHSIKKLWPKWLIPLPIDHIPESYLVTNLAIARNSN